MMTLNEVTYLWYVKATICVTDVTSLAQHSYKVGEFLIDSY